MRIAFVFPPMLVAGRPIDFSNFWDDKRGSTGSEIQILAMAKETAARGHDCALYIDAPNAEAWEGLCLRGLDALHREAPSYDAVCVSLDFNIFRGLSENPLRVCFQQINGFEYGHPGFDAFVDVYVSPSENHKDFLKNGGWPVDPSKWEVIPNGCYPNGFDQDIERREHVMIWASSPDRGLHLALQEYPLIKKAVPDAELHIYYYALPRWIAEWQGYGVDQPHWAGWQREHSRRALYVARAFEKLQPFGVKVIGATSRRQMAREMAGAGVLAFPCDTISYTEGFSCATMEAAAAGCLPIISPADALGSIYGGHVPMVSGRARDCMPEWRELVIKALTNKRWAAWWREQARALAEKHDWKILAGKLEEVLEKRIAEKRGKVA
jgi:glycosyltransferase involved in cell wall biosynthesis